MNRIVDFKHDPDLAKIEPALRRASARARKLSEETNTPFYVFEEGKIVDLRAERADKPDPNFSPR